MPDFVIPDLPETIISRLQARAKASGRTPEEEARSILAAGAHAPILPYWVNWQGPTIPCTELGEATPSDPLAVEWNTYRREVTRLIAEGHEGRCALIKRDTIHGIYDNFEAARREGAQRFGREGFLVRPILAKEPQLKIRGYNLPCKSSASL